jgi:hypothetical protein
MKTSQLTIIDLAEELKRLAVSVARDARKSSELTCLSSLTAMQPLQSLLLQALTSEINVVNQQESEPRIPFGFSN